VSHDANEGVWGVVTWAHIDPRVDYFVVHVQGLTNAYKFVDPAGAFKAGDAPGTGRKLLKKTLQLNFWRPGDTVDLKEEEVHFGLPTGPRSGRTAEDSQGIRDRKSRLITFGFTGKLWDSAMFLNSRDQTWSRCRSISRVGWRFTGSL